MSERYRITFTKAELRELQNLLANGVCDFDDPSNKVARSAYDKLLDAKPMKEARHD